MGERTSFHWVTNETVLLFHSFSNVSNEEGGPSVFQTHPHVWDMVAARYNSFIPPLPTDKSRRTGPPREKATLINKWTRMQPFISHYLKCEVSTLANHKSGESANQDT